MAFANILTILTGAADDALTLETAARMAHQAQGVVNVIVAPPMLVVEDWVGTSSGYGAPSAVREAARRAQLDLRRTVEALARELTQGLGLEIDEASGRIILVEEQGAQLLDLSDQTPFTDLVVVGRHTLQDLGLWSGLISGALLQARLPVLVISAPSEVFAPTVAIAWNGSATAARAVHAALPFLVAADHVVILQDPDHLRISERRTASPERLTDYLRRHGVGAVSIRREPGASRGDGLARLATACGAGLLVVGAFEHSRLREDLIGGVTASLIAERGTFNLLFAH